MIKLQTADVTCQRSHLNGKTHSKSKMCPRSSNPAKSQLVPRNELVAGKELLTVCCVFSSALLEAFGITWAGGQMSWHRPSMLAHMLLAGLRFEYLITFNVS